MEIGEDELNEGDFFEGVLLETVKEAGVTRPRVQPVSGLPRHLKTKFPRQLREDNLIGTRFSATVKVCQKHERNGSPRGGLYLDAVTDSIEKISNFRPNQRVFAVLKPDSKSGRAYEYFFEEYKETESPLDVLRKEAYAAAKLLLDPKVVDTNRRDRSALIKKYAVVRSNGVCEACGEDAPFVTRNGQPYLEVHHIVGVANGGADHPANVAAICPNCHRHVEHGVDGKKYNDKLRVKIVALEEGRS